MTVCRIMVGRGRLFLIHPEVTRVLVALDLPPCQSLPGHIRLKAEVELLLKDRHVSNEKPALYSIPTRE